MCGMLGPFSSFPLAKCSHQRYESERFKSMEKSFPVNKSNEMPEGNDVTMKSGEVVVQIVTSEAQAGQRLLLFGETKRTPEVKMFSWSLTRRGLEVKCQKSKRSGEPLDSLSHLFIIAPPTHTHTHLNSI